MPLCALEAHRWVSRIDIAIDARGVGQRNDPHPVANVRGANGGCGYTIENATIPERRQAPENLLQSARAKEADVFDKALFWMRFFDEPGELEP